MSWKNKWMSEWMNVGMNEGRNEWLVLMNYVKWIVGI